MQMSPLELGAGYQREAHGYIGSSVSWGTIFCLPAKLLGCRCLRWCELDFHSFPWKSWTLWWLYQQVLALWVCAVNVDGVLALHKDWLPTATQLLKLSKTSASFHLLLWISAVPSCKEFSTCNAVPPAWNQVPSLWILLNKRRAFIDDLGHPNILWSFSILSCQLYNFPFWSQHTHTHLCNNCHCFLTQIYFMTCNRVTANLSYDLS